MYLQYVNSFIPSAFIQSDSPGPGVDTGIAEIGCVKEFHVTEASGGCLGHTQEGHPAQGLGDKQGSWGR